MGFESFSPKPSNKKEDPKKDLKKIGLGGLGAVVAAASIGAIATPAEAQEINQRQGEKDRIAAERLDGSGQRIQRIDGSGSGYNRINLTPAEEDARDRAEARGEDAINLQSGDDDGPNVRPLNMNAEEWMRMKRAEDAAKKAGNANEKSKFDYLEDW